MTSFNVLLKHGLTAHSSFALYLVKLEVRDTCISTFPIRFTVNLRRSLCFKRLIWSVDIAPFLRSQ